MISGLGKRLYISILAGLFFALLVQSCSSPTSAPLPPESLPTTIPNTITRETPAGGFSGELKIAVIVPMTGPAATFGTSTWQGAQIAVDEWNVRGGVQGRKVVAVVGDSQCDGNTALSAANQIIGVDQVHYIIGDVCSSGSVAISESAESEGVVQISPASTMDRLTQTLNGATKQYVFRACFTDSFQGVAIGKFTLDDLKLKRAFILYNLSNDYTTNLAKTFEQTFTAGGGQIVGKATYSPDDTDFSVIFDRIIKSRPEIIFLGDFYTVVNFIIGRARASGITTPFIGADGWDSPELDRTEVDGSYFSTHFSPQDQRPIVQAWLKTYQIRYGSVPDALATLGYDAANILLASITQAGVDDPLRVAEAMAGLRWEGVTGTIAFDSRHNPIKPVVMMQVKDGRVNYVTTEAP